MPQLASRVKRNILSSLHGPSSTLDATRRLAEVEAYKASQSHGQPLQRATKTVLMKITREGLGMIT